MVQVCSRIKKQQMSHHILRISSKSLNKDIGREKKKNRELFENGDCVILFRNLNRSKELIRGELDEMGS